MGVSPRETMEEQEGMSFPAAKKLFSLLARSKATRLLTMGLLYSRQNPI
jgi:hypothetical protein